MNFLLGVFIICVFLLLSLYGYLKNKPKLADFSFLIALMFFVVGLARLGMVELAKIPSYNEKLIAEIVKEKPILTKEELSELSSERLKKLLSKIKEEKEAKIMRAVTEKINMEYMDDTESMKGIPQTIEF